MGTQGLQGPGFSVQYHTSKNIFKKQVRDRDGSAGNSCLKKKKNKNDQKTYFTFSLVVEVLAFKVLHRGRQISVYRASPGQPGLIHREAFSQKTNNPKNRALDALLQGPGSIPSTRTGA